MNQKELLFSVLRAGICGEQTENAQDTEETLAELFSLAVKHDLAHIAGQVLGKRKGAEKFAQAAMGAVQRYLMQNAAFGAVCAVLEGAKIPFLPLKGSVLRHFYPDPWLRTSCDIDLLVQEENLESAAAALEQRGWRRGEKHSHDLSLYSPTGVHLELHFTVMEDSRMPAAQGVLSRFWQDAKPAQEGCCLLKSSDEMFYFYHMAHMAKHLEGGGCGVRSFLDVWVLNHRMKFDKAARNALLEEGGLLSFAKAAEHLAEVWFSRGEHTAVTRALEQFVLEGGIYGNLENRVAYRSTKKGSENYVRSRIFMRTDSLKEQYPVLREHRWLAPFCQVHRWGKIVVSGRLRRGVKELQAKKTASAETVDSVQTLLEHLGI